MGLHQTKEFCTAKENINQIKRQSTEWGNIFTYTSDKGDSYPKFTKNLTKFHTNKQTNQSKMGKGPEQTLLQRGHTDGQQIYRKMLNVPNHQKNAN